jgi:predicted metal-dependent phosphotriesterase family hydrolase
MTTVETALGPVATDALGPTLMHEHIVTRSPGVHENWPHLFPREAILALAERKMADLAAPAKYEAEYTTSETHRWVARDVP